MVMLWSGEPGRVIGMPDPSVPGSARFIKLMPDHTFEDQTAIITRITVSQETNHQFLHTIGGLIYIYVFGDRIGQVVVQGIAFAKDCADESGVGEGGAEKMLEYYKDNRLTAREEEMEVTIGKTPIRGFLTGSSLDIVDPKTRLGQFTYKLATVPEDQEMGSGGGIPGATQLPATGGPTLQGARGGSPGTAIV